MNIKAYKMSSGNWRCQVYKGQRIVNGKKKPYFESFTAPTESEAIMMGIKFAAKLGNLKNSNMTFREASISFLSKRSKVLSPTTIYYYGLYLKDGKGLDPILDKDIKEITQEDIQQVINIYMLDHKPKSTRNIHGFISTVMRTYNPELKLHTTLPQKIKPERSIPTDDDIKKLIIFCDNSKSEKCMVIPIMLGAFCGLRRGEVCGLQYEDIDYKNCMLHINHSKAYANRSIILKSPKTVSSDRYVKAPKSLIDRIGAGTGFVVKDLTINSLSSRFWHIWRRANIKHIRFHDLRHYYASSLHALSIPDAYIMAQGGWSTDTVLKSVYRNVLDDKENEFIDISTLHFENIMSEKSDVKVKTN